MTRDNDFEIEFLGEFEEEKNQTPEESLLGEELEEEQLPFQDDIDALVDKITDLHSRMIPFTLLSQEHEPQNIAQELLTYRDVWQRVYRHTQKEKLPEKKLADFSRYARQTLQVFHRHYQNQGISIDALLSNSLFYHYLTSNIDNQTNAIFEVMFKLCDYLCQLSNKSPDHQSLCLKSFPPPVAYLQCVKSAAERMDSLINALAFDRHHLPFIESHEVIQLQNADLLKYLVYPGNAIHIPTYLNYAQGITTKRIIDPQSQIPLAYSHDFHCNHGQRFRDFLKQKLAQEVFLTPIYQALENITEIHSDFTPESFDPSNTALMETLKAKFDQYGEDIIHIIAGEEIGIINFDSPGIQALNEETRNKLKSELDNQTEFNPDKEGEVNRIWTILQKYVISPRESIEYHYPAPTGFLDMDQIYHHALQETPAIAFLKEFLEANPITSNDEPPLVIDTVDLFKEKTINQLVNALRIEDNNNINPHNLLIAFETLWMMGDMLKGPSPTIFIEVMQKLSRDPVAYIRDKVAPHIIQYLPYQAEKVQRIIDRYDYYLRKPDLKPYFQLTTHQRQNISADETTEFPLAMLLLAGAPTNRILEHISHYDNQESDALSQNLTLEDIEDTIDLFAAQNSDSSLYTNQLQSREDYHQILSATYAKMKKSRSKMPLHFATKCLEQVSRFMPQESLETIQNHIAQFTNAELLKQDIEDGISQYQSSPNYPDIFQNLISHPESSVIFDKLQHSLNRNATFSDQVDIESPAKLPARFLRKCLEEASSVNDKAICKMLLDFFEIDNPLLDRSATTVEEWHRAAQSWTGEQEEEIILEEEELALDEIALVEEESKIEYAETKSDNDNQSTASTAITAENLEEEPNILFYDNLALYYAAFHNNPELLNHFLDAGCNHVLLTRHPDDDHDLIPVFVAAQEGNIEVMDAIFNFYGYHENILNIMDSEGNSLLHIAAEHNHPEMLRYLIEAQVKITANTYGQTPVISAVRGNALEALTTFKDLLEDTALFTQRYDNESPPALTAVEEAFIGGHYDVLDTLMECGVTADMLNQPSPAFENKPLIHYLTAHRQTDAIKLLLKHGGDINATDEISGNTPLHIAALIGSNSTLASLLKQGADPHIQNTNGHTVFDIIAIKKSMPMTTSFLYYLIKNNPSIITKDYLDNVFDTILRECNALEIIDNATGSNILQYLMLQHGTQTFDGHSLTDIIFTSLQRNNTNPLALAAHQNTRGENLIDIAIEQNDLNAIEKCFGDVDPLARFYSDGASLLQRAILKKDFDAIQTLLEKTDLVQFAESDLFPIFVLTTIQGSRQGLIGIDLMNDLQLRAKNEGKEEAFDEACNRCQILIQDILAQQNSEQNGEKQGDEKTDMPLTSNTPDDNQDMPSSEPQPTSQRANQMPDNQKTSR